MVQRAFSGGVSSGNYAGGAWLRDQVTSRLATGEATVGPLRSLYPPSAADNACRRYFKDLLRGPPLAAAAVPFSIKRRVLPLRYPAAQSIQTRSRSLRASLPEGTGESCGSCTGQPTRRGIEREWQGREGLLGGDVFRGQMPAGRSAGLSQLSLNSPSFLAC